MFTRYSVYFVPHGVWGDTGASWLGWDSRTGQSLGPATDLTKRPSKYGFHATIKAPFRLADGASVDDLIAGLKHVAADLSPIPLRSLEVAQLGRFFALKAPRENDLIRPLAAEVVRDLDAFRAPLTDAEIARRRPDRLSDAQRAMLEAWGYPHVMEQFDFHLTLTGPTKDPASASAQLNAHFKAAFQTPMVLDSLSVLGEDASGQFHQIERVPLPPA